MGLLSVLAVLGAGCICLMLTVVVMELFDDQRKKGEDDEKDN